MLLSPHGHWRFETALHPPRSRKAVKRKNKGQLKTSSQLRPNLPKRETKQKPRITIGTTATALSLNARQLKRCYLFNRTERFKPNSSRQFSKSFDCHPLVKATYVLAFNEELTGLKARDQRIVNEHGSTTIPNHHD